MLFLEDPTESTSATATPEGMPFITSLLNSMLIIYSLNHHCTKYDSLKKSLNVKCENSKIYILIVPNCFSSSKDKFQSLK